MYVAVIHFLRFCTPTLRPALIDPEKVRQLRAAAGGLSLEVGTLGSAPADAGVPQVIAAP